MEIALKNVKVLVPDNPREKKLYVDAVMAFDIETTRLPDDNSVMYIWQCAVMVESTVYLQVGRTWEEWVALVKGLTLGSAKVICYVHNLAYEFQFLAGVWDFSGEETMFAKSRKPIKVTMGALEMRCSYIWSNMSLSKFLSNMGVEHEKLSGAEYDYRKMRYPWTELSSAEMAYCEHDVLGLVEAAEKKWRLDGDTPYTVPLTSTGYVRRDAKRVLRSTCAKSLVPDATVYKMLREAFRGGNTHANRYYVGEVLPNIDSVDRSSSYPDVMINQLFPMTPFKPTGVADAVKSLREGKAVLCRLHMDNVTLSDAMWGCPYIPYSKCRNVRSAVLDNGRILSADSLDITVTDVDLQIILEEYDANVEMADVYVADKAPLPAPFRELIEKYYRGKTELKGVEGKEYEYGKSKALLNSLYGMTATDPCKPEIVFDGSQYGESERDYESVQQRCEIPYQWGVWVTAYARKELEEMIANVGSKFAYADTDSCKYLHDDSISWGGYNERCKSNSERNGAVATDPKGIAHYMGVAEYEGMYSKFLTWGAKKYAYLDKTLHCTIAGVRKGDVLGADGRVVEMGGASELAQAGGIEALQPGFVFRQAGGLASVYNDEIDELREIEGHALHVTRNVCLVPSEYTLGITDEYANIVEQAKNVINPCQTEHDVV